MGAGRVYLNGPDDAVDSHAMELVNSMAFDMITYGVSYGVAGAMEQGFKKGALNALIKGSTYEKLMTLPAKMFLTDVMFDTAIDFTAYNATKN